MMTERPESGSFRPEPPQPLIPDTPSPRPFPLEALGPLQEAVKTVQRLTQAPVEIAAQSALAVASLAVQGHVDVQTLGGVRPTSLNMMTIAQSGERKSSCDDLLMGPIHAFEREQIAEHRKKVQTFELELAVWEDAQNKLASELKGGTRGREEMETELAALGEKPPRPRSPERFVTEPTFEGLTKFLDLGQPSVGIFSDEGGQFLGGHAMSREQRVKTMAAFNNLWQGKPIKRTRSGDGHVTLLGRRVAMHLMVQPLVADQFLSDSHAEDIGLLARLLIAKPDSTIGTRTYDATHVPMTALKAFQSKVSEILVRPMPMDDHSGALSPRLLKLSPEAKKALIGYSDRAELAQRDGGKLAGIRGAASKSAEQAARIAAVLAAYENIDATEITAEQMRHGTMLASYYLLEALRLSEVNEVDEIVQDAEQVRQFLFNTWAEPYVTPRDIQQNGPTGLRRQLPRIRKILAILDDHGWIMQLPCGTEINGTARKEPYKIVGKAVPETEPE